VSVSLAHEEGLVVYRPEQISAPDIAVTLRQIGYSVRDPRKMAGYEAEEAELAGERNRLLAGLATTLVTLTLMAFHWAGHPLTVTTEGHAWQIGPWIILGLAVAMMVVVARPILVTAWQSLRRGIFNQHVLLEAGAFGGLAGGILGPFVSPSVFPPGDFLSVAVFITTYHLLSGWGVGAGAHHLLAGGAGAAGPAARHRPGAPRRPGDRGARRAGPGRRARAGPAR
jgi:Cu+-exporting ATPase